MSKKQITSFQMEYILDEIEATYIASKNKNIPPKVKQLMVEAKKIKKKLAEMEKLSDKYDSIEMQLDRMGYDETDYETGEFKCIYIPDEVSNKIKRELAFAFLGDIDNVNTLIQSLSKKYCK